MKIHKKELAKTYDPKSFESRIYQNWEQQGYFTPDRNPDQKPYTMVIPPPNITGTLHMGHALDGTLQDILIRFKRMQGYAALWLPGTDHASIATEAKIVEQMREENLSKEDLGREAFLKRSWAWKQQYGGRIVTQLKTLGASCDWSRERFTLDQGCSHAVNEVFVRLYEKGLIYRGKRMINWCPHCLTSISDAEVSYEDQSGHFYHLRYPLADGSGDLILATTRPETMLGDTAVAVHPDDPRYQHLIGKTLTLPLVGRKIPIVADTYVSMEFGTGVVKITPAHDPNDYEVGLRHDLPIETVMTETAHMTAACGPYAGLDRYVARKAIVTDLKQQGFLVKVEDHQHNVGQCYRCDTTVEPRLSHQWFVKMQPLAAPAIQAVKNGAVTFVPARFDKTYFHWMEHIKDWCISRQLWWGHRIPAYYCDDCQQVTVQKESPSTCPHCNSEHIRQDEDTLDTWFSSALWPFSTLGWPEKTPDLAYFYPTQTLVTGYDIIFFWVARMIFSALEHTDTVPFDTVLIHGLVRDEQGRKMSKSLGNGIDPLAVIDTYGADALRFMLAHATAPGNDMRYAEDKVLAARNFSNKLWNAARFIQMNLPDDSTADGTLTSEQLPLLPLEDRWILSHYNTLVGEVTENLEKFEFGVALAKLYEFTWRYFCDWYIELTKPRIQAGGDTALLAQNVLLYVMKNTLKLLHVFMPFITEEIYTHFWGSEGATDAAEEPSIMISSFPIYEQALSFSEEAQNFSKVIDAIHAIRAARAEKNIPPKKKSPIYVDATDADFALFASCEPFFAHLASAVALERCDTAGIPDALSVVTDHARMFLPMSDLIDKQAEIDRLTREILSCEQEIDKLTVKLANTAFTDKAPPQVVQAERDKLALASDKLQKLHATLSSLS